MLATLEIFFDRINRGSIMVLLSLIFLITAGCVLKYFFRDEGKTLSPATHLRPLPGPERNVLGNNAGQFNPVAPFFTFQKWARKYGPIFQVKLGSQHIISVNDPVMAKELFEKRGNKYSSRIPPHVSFDLLSQGRRIAFAPSGAMHRAFRKQMQSILSITRTSENQKHQELESRQLLQDVLRISKTTQDFNNDDTKIQSALRRYTASVMFTLAFGHRIPDIDDGGFAKTIFDIMNDNAISVQPGRYYADIFPILRKLPYFLRTWQHEVERKIKWQWPFLYRLLSQTEKQKENRISNPGIVRALIDQRSSMTPQEQADNFIDDKSIAYQSLTIVEAGADTTAISLMNFVLAMALYPAVLKKGQVAVDDAVSDSRLPTFTDMVKLQYIRQIVSETLRWRPPITMGIPHANTVDDDINGFFIPKNSIIIGNIWAMHQNPTHYHDPERFEPARYDHSAKLAFDSSLEPNAMDRNHYTFGWGRRICPGMHLAESSLLLLVARILWTFDIVRATDAAGRPYPLSADPLKDYDNSIIQSPKAFPVVFRLRSDKRGSVIQESHTEAMRVWNELDLDLFSTKSGGAPQKA